MSPTTMHKHRRNKSEVNRNWCRLQYASSDILSRQNFCWYSGKCVSKFFIATHSLQKNKYKDIYCDQYIIDKRGKASVGIIITNWKHGKTFNSDIQRSGLKIFKRTGIILSFDKQHPHIQTVRSCLQSFVKM